MLKVVKLMAESPPSYSEVLREDAAAAVGHVQHTGHYEGRQDTENCHTGRSRGRRNRENRHAARPEDRQNNSNNRDVGFEGIHNATGHDNTVDNNNNNEGTRNTSNSFSGFIDVMYEKKKLPRSCGVNLMYKVGLVVYFFANFVYAIVAATLQKEEVVYYVIYGCLSLIGCVFELILIIAYIRRLVVQAFMEEREFNLPQEGGTPTTLAQDYPRKARSVIVDYVLLSLGECLIHPVLICTLYGFVNERAWEFGSAIAICNLVFFSYSVIMEVIYIKFNLTLFVIRITHAS